MDEFNTVTKYTHDSDNLSIQCTLCSRSGNYFRESKSIAYKSDVVKTNEEIIYFVCLMIITNICAKYSYMIIIFNIFRQLSFLLLFCGWIFLSFGWPFFSRLQVFLYFSVAIPLCEFFFFSSHLISSTLAFGYRP